jgi:DNA-binding GntR family transcriptional regulator
MQRVAERPNISEELVETVRAMILSGALNAGSRINEVHLAAQLGISRTPLREALTRLVTEGAITSAPRLGFFVCPLSVEEVENLYPMRALLDPAALRISGLPPPDRLERLERLTRRFAEAVDPEQAVRLDDEWHLELIAGCTNPILLGFIEQMIWRTRRYELALMRARANVERATGDHEAILARLEAGDLEGACAALKRNMESGMQPILDWLAAREG